MIYIVLLEISVCHWTYEAFRTKREALAYIDSLKNPQEEWRQRYHNDQIELREYPTPKNKADVTEMLNIVSTWVTSH